MKRFKIYYFSPKSLNFVEAKWFRTKLAATTLGVGIILFILLFEIGSLFDNVLGLGLRRNASLQAENLMLKSQLSTFSQRLANLEQDLTKLNDHGNEFRLMVDLPKIDPETKEAGFGGTDERIDLSSNAGVNRILNSLQLSMEKAERELQLQQMSYKDVILKYEEDKVKFRYIPSIRPMEGYYNVYGFGMRYHPVLRVMRFHEGMDITNEEGTPIYVSGDGVVKKTGRHVGEMGNMVIVDHGYGYITIYGHLNQILVQEGQKVGRGQLIARCGRTGTTTGPHLHYEVWVNGVAQNPIDYFFDDVGKNKFFKQLAQNNQQ
ncbi:MAG: M23 family metallopeptidase [bacterium]